MDETLLWILFALAAACLRIRINVLIRYIRRKR